LITFDLLTLCLDPNIEGKEDMTELGKDLAAYIQLRGPITVHDFMSQALNHGIHGYYQRKEKKIGEEGDFVTAPEISQLFGEMVAIWCVSVWQNMGSPPKFNLVEMGPGRGTLMKDILTAAGKFPDFCGALDVHLVELSATMRELQRTALECKSITPGDVKVMQRKSNVKRGKDNNLNMNIHWHHFLSEVPQGPSIYLGQEFLDAFPVHQFAYTNRGWCEKMIDICQDPNESNLNFKFVLAPNSTPAVKLLLDGVEDLYTAAGKQPEEGDVLEVNPLAIGAVEDVSKRVAIHGGAALFVDYGETFAPGDTLRGYLKHVSTHPLSKPGHVDISCDVDFGTLKMRAKEFGVVVPPIVGQGEFLVRMGLVPRLEMLVNSDKTTEEQAKSIVEGAKRLIEQDQMGLKYKVMALHDKGFKIEGFE